MKTNKILTAGAIALSMILTGCSASSTETKDTKTTEVAKKKKVKTLGKKTKDSKSLKMTNNTGKKITVFETKSSSEESFGDNLLDDGDAVKNKEDKVNLGVTKNTASTNSSSNKNNSSSSSSKPSSKPSNSGNNSSSSKPSNNSGSNSSSSKPAEHKHDWIAQYKTVNVPEKGHNEQVLVKDAWDEQVPITEMQEFSICNQCGADITGNTTAHMKNSYLNGGNCSGYHSEWREVVTGYTTVHHDAVYETRYVVDSPATTKQELVGYKCSGCGKTKSN